MGEWVVPGAGPDLFDRLERTLPTRAVDDLKVDRDWFDTFDWRLASAGLMLRRDRPGGIVLLDSSGRTVAAAGGIEITPFPADLADERLRRALVAACDVRALLKTASVHSRARTLAVLDEEDKTVARVVLEEATGLPPRVRVVPLRGYTPHARRVGKVLESALGATPAGDLMDAVLAAAGRRVGDYTGGIHVVLLPHTPAGAAVRAICRDLLDTVEANVDGTVEEIDTEFLHDLRVAVRRLRSAVKLVGDALPPAARDHFAAEFAWLGAVTTPARDLDVYLLDFDALTGGLPELAADLEPFRAYLARQRRLVQGELAGALGGVRFAAATSGFRDLLERRPPVAPGPDAASTPVADFARERIVRAFDTVRRRGRRIGPDTPAAALHNLRKRAKELRYLLEFFGTLYDPASYRNALRELKALQDNLGTFQDTEVQREAVREYGAAMHAGGVAGAPTLLAMGELAAALREQQGTARAEFAERFARFDERAHVVELVSTGTV